MTAQTYTLPRNWITLRHLILSGKKQIDCVLARDETDGKSHLLQIVDGKSATIRSGESANANFESILNAPGCVEISTFPWIGTHNENPS